jgi:hypothetical protein
MAKTAQVETAKPATGAAASKKNHVASTLLIFPALFFLLAILGFNFMNPLDTYAQPRYGFTPQPPPPPPPPPGGGDSDEDGDEDGSDQPAPNDVTVQIENCNLSCSTGMGLREGDGGGALLASASTTNPLLQTAGPGSYSPVFHEMLLHVRLIHLGSGWIAEGTISDAKAVSFALPYPGDWQVFLLDAPEFAGDSPDLTGTNLETLQTSLSKGPLYLGVVQANTGEPQQLPCPLNCPTAASDFTPAPAPAALPESGAASLPLPLLPFIGAALLWGMAFLTYQRYRALLPASAPITGTALARLRADRRVDSDCRVGESVDKTRDAASQRSDI